MIFFNFITIAAIIQYVYEANAFPRFSLGSCRVKNSCSSALKVFAVGQNNNRKNKQPVGKPPVERRNKFDTPAKTRHSKPIQASSKPPVSERHQIIERIIPLKDRVPLSNLKVGQKCRGQIVSVVKHGYFIDVGTTKDGLAHISDISKDYFIQNALSRFSPGQEVDVWIKFVDPVNSKLGLQMFPVTSSSDISELSSTTNIIKNRKPIIFFPSESQVNGTVIKVSDLGVFVDIGANVDAFLPKRKMKLTKKQMSFKPVSTLLISIYTLHSKYYILRFD